MYTTFFFIISRRRWGKLWIISTEPSNLHQFLSCTLRCRYYFNNNFFSAIMSIKIDKWMKTFKKCLFFIYFFFLVAPWLSSFSSTECRSKISLSSSILISHQKKKILKAVKTCGMKGKYKKLINKRGKYAA